MDAPIPGTRSRYALHEHFPSSTHTLTDTRTLPVRLPHRRRGAARPVHVTHVLQELPGGGGRAYAPCRLCPARGTCFACHGCGSQDRATSHSTLLHARANAHARSHTRPGPATTRIHQLKLVSMFTSGAGPYTFVHCTRVCVSACACACVHVCVQSCMRQARVLSADANSKMDGNRRAHIAICSLRGSAARRDPRCRPCRRTAGANSSEAGRTCCRAASLHDTKRSGTRKASCGGEPQTRTQIRDSVD